MTMRGRRFKFRRVCDARTGRAVRFHPIQQDQGSSFPDEGKLEVNRVWSPRSVATDISRWQMRRQVFL